ncbi:hypothetical protein ACFX1Z_024514 [Malus domestica]
MMKPYPNAIALFETLATQSAQRGKRKTKAPMKKAGMYEINSDTGLEAKVETLGKQMANLISMVSQQYQN